MDDGIVWLPPAGAPRSCYLPELLKAMLKVNASYHQQTTVHFASIVLKSSDKHKGYRAIWMILRIKYMYYIHCTNLDTCVHAPLFMESKYSCYF